MSCQQPIPSTMTNVIFSRTLCGADGLLSQDLGDVATPHHDQFL